MDLKILRYIAIQNKTSKAKSTLEWTCNLLSQSDRKHIPDDGKSYLATANMDLKAFTDSKHFKCYIIWLKQPV